MIDITLYPSLCVAYGSFKLYVCIHPDASSNSLSVFPSFLPSNDLLSLPKCTSDVQSPSLAYRFLSVFDIEYCVCVVGYLIFFPPTFRTFLRHRISNFASISIFSLWFFFFNVWNSRIMKYLNYISKRLLIIIYIIQRGLYLSFFQGRYQTQTPWNTLRRKCIKTFNIIAGVIHTHL